MNATPPDSSNDRTLSSQTRRNLALALGVGAILAVAFAWRLLGITSTEIWRDEAVSVLHARASWSGLLFRLAWVEDTPPLNFILLKAWSLLWSSQTGLRMLSVLVGVAFVAVMMAAARRMFPRAWWSTGLLAALAPVSLHYSQEIRVYILQLLAVATCFWLAERIGATTCPTGAVPASKARQTRLLAGLSLAAALAAHCHAIGLFVYPMMLAYLLVRIGRPALRLLRHWAGAPLWLLLVLPMVVFSLHWARVHREACDWWINPINWYFARYFAGDFVGFGLIRQWQSLRSLDRLWSAFLLQRFIVTAVAVLIAAGLIDPRTRRTILALVAAATTYLSLLWLSSVIGLPNIIERTLLPAHVPLLLMFGIGGAAGASRVVRWTAGLSTLGLAFLLAIGWVWLVYSGLPRRDQSLEAFQWLRPRVQPGDLFFFTPDWYEDLAVYHLKGCLSSDQIYSRSAPVYAGSPPVHRTIPRVADRHWAERFRSALAGRQAVYLLNYRGSQADDAAAILAQQGFSFDQAFLVPGNIGMTVQLFTQAGTATAPAGR